MHLEVYQDVQWSSVTCIAMMNSGFARNTMSALYDHAKQYDNDDVRVVINRMVESCMSIYLRMAMEMP